MVDGVNSDGTNVYICNNPAQFADNTAAGYTAAGTVPPGASAYIRDLMDGLTLLPSNDQGANDNSFVGDTLVTGTGWKMLTSGGSSKNGGMCGVFTTALSSDPMGFAPQIGTRIAYVPN